MAVRAYSVDWILHLHIKVILRPPLEDVVYQRHASYIKMLLWHLESKGKNMDMDFLNKMNDIHSFVVLQEIFESWIKEGVINEKTLELRSGYSFLIAYPSIYLTKDSAKKEIAAAKVCHEILMKYAKDEFKNDLTSENEKTRLATSLLVLPPEKYILTTCSEFFHLNYFLKGVYPDFTDEQLANINGDDYAKVWLNIFSKGYHFEETERAIDADFKHLNEALIIISKMHLSPQYEEEMDVEKIKSQFKKYYHDNSIGNSGTGCLISMLLFLLSSIMIACSI